MRRTYDVTDYNGVPLTPKVPMTNYNAYAGFWIFFFLIFY